LIGIDIACNKYCMANRLGRNPIASQSRRESTMLNPDMRGRIFTAAGTLFLFLVLNSNSFAADGNKGPKDNANLESPVRGIQRDLNSQVRHRKRRDGYRTIDGSGNNLTDPTLNAAQTQLNRMMPADYADYVGQMSGLDRPGPREISNAVSDQAVSIFNTLDASDYVWQWGQFVDHDIDLTGGVFPAEPAPVQIPPGDLHFDPDATGNQVMQFNRSIYDPSSGTGPDNSRQQMNEITGWIDASNVYGSDEIRAAELRTNDGTGRLKTSNGRLLPFNTAGLPNAGGDSDKLFLAGDVRANEQSGLVAMHTLFVREHNRLTNRIRRNNPNELTGDEIYEKARRIVGAQVQVITYREFIPALLGRNALSRYRGYESNVDPRIMNEFSTAAYRLGHSLLNAQILRTDRRGHEISAGHLPLRNSFFAPNEIIDHGIEPILRGLSQQLCQNLDAYVVDDVRNFLFGAPGQGGFDLASLNIQRGRDHGLPSYNDTRERLGLSRVTSFDQITSDSETQARLASIYINTDQIDLWVGGLAEDHRQAAIVGELFFRILKRQFEVLRDGDRFWYQRYLTRAELAQVRNVRLADIIRRNTRIGQELSRDVFHVTRSR